MIPLGRVIQSTTDESLDPLTLLVCPDESGEARGVLYEDDGDGYGYQSGSFLLTTYCAETRGGKLIVGIAAEEGGMKRPERTTSIEIITSRGVARLSGSEKDGTIATIDA